MPASKAKVDPPAPYRPCAAVSCCCCCYCCSCNCQAYH
jgi:hypothetical protein